MTGDHFYTTSLNERNNGIETHGYVDEGISCHVFNALNAPGQTIVSLYRLYARWNGDHFYTTSLAESDSAIAGGYRYEGIQCSIFSQQDTNTVPFYRLYNAGNGDHFYTTSATERNRALQNGYNSEGTTGYVYLNSGSNRQILYRLYGPWNGDHFYTTSLSEKNSAVNGGYTYEGIACYVPIAPAQAPRIPLYRLFAPWNGDHFYTTDTNERGSAINGGYIAEGIACYVSGSNVANSTPLYRLYAPSNGDHFYTTSASERNSAVAGGYVSEGVACYVFSSPQPGTIPLFRLYKGLSAYLGVNIILVGNDSFNQTDRQKVRDSLKIAREIFAKVSLGIDNVQWYGITSAQAGSKVIIDNESEASDLTDDWTVPNKNLDLFVVKQMNGADGWSAVDGSCDKNGKGMTGSVVSLNGTTANSGNTFAHEMGHYLGLDHIDDTGNFIGGDGSSNSWTGIYQWQGSEMKEHCFIKR